MEVEHPVSCRYSSTFHFHATLPGMLGALLIRHQVVQVGQPCEKRLLAATGMMKAFHGKQFPLDGIMRLIQERAGHRHLGVCKDRIPAHLLLVYPAPYPLAIRRPSRGHDVLRKATQPLAQRRR